MARKKTDDIAEARPSSPELERGLPEFYDRLTGVLKTQAAGGGKAEPKHYAPSTTLHGKESLRLGYTLSQVVHGYGVICQAITETAQLMDASISPGEFSTLNLSLDVAIAEAVSGFASRSREVDAFDSTKRIGVLVHELSNSLSCVILTHAMVRKGVVGMGGSTNAVMERSLGSCTRELLDRSFAEIRLHHDPVAERRPMFLIEAVEEVEVAASEEARLKGLSVEVTVDSGLRVNADRNYLVSALSNLVRNAIKFTKPGGTVRVRSVFKKNIPSSSKWRMNAAACRRARPRNCSSRSLKRTATGRGSGWGFPSAAGPSRSTGAC